MRENDEGFSQKYSDMSKNDEQKPANLRENERENTQNPAKTDIENPKTDIDSSKTDTKTDIELFPSLLVKNVYELIRFNRKIKYTEMEDNLGVTERTIARAIDVLKEMGYINKEHSKVKGVWQLL